MTRVARRLAVIATAGLSVLAMVLLFFAVKATRASDADPSDRTAVREWWASAEPAITDLQKSLYDSEFALRRYDIQELTAGCQQMHDAAAVDVPAQLPSPDRKLTAELTSAADDAHTAAHMCLAVAENSSNNYDGEFISTLDQAERNLRTAMVLVNRALTAHTPRAGRSGNQ